MAITDSSTELTTTYTEQTIVAFTAGTLSTISDCVSEVEARLKRGTLSTSSTPTLAQVQNWLVAAKQELSQSKGFTWKRRYATASTVASQYRYALPPDYCGGRTSLRDTSNDRSITIWLDHYFDTKYPDPSAETTGEPQVATIKNMELWLVPPPDAVYTLEIEYDRSGDDNTATDISWLPQLERFHCCDFASWRAFLSLHRWEEAQMYERLWDKSVGKAIRADGKRRWKSMNYQMIDSLSEYNMRKHQ